MSEVTPSSIANEIEQIASKALDAGLCVVFGVGNKGDSNGNAKGIVGMKGACNVCVSLADTLADWVERQAEL